MDKLEMIKKIKDDRLIRSLSFCKLKGIFLVGGGVLDILERKTPKDYDFIVHDKSLHKFVEYIRTLGFEISYDTKTAITFKRRDEVIQILKKSLEDFDFSIAKTRYDILNAELLIDLEIYKNKLLIPCSYEPSNALNSLSRLPHWAKKGYIIDSRTYHSLILAIHSGFKKDFNS